MFSWVVCVLTCTEKSLKTGQPLLCSHWCQPRPVVFSIHLHWASETNPAFPPVSLKFNSLSKTGLEYSIYRAYEPVNIRPNFFSGPNCPFNFHPETGRVGDMQENIQWIPEWFPSVKWTARPERLTQIPPEKSCQIDASGVSEENLDMTRLSLSFWGSGRKDFKRLTPVQDSALKFSASGIQQGRLGQGCGGVITGRDFPPDCTGFVTDALSPHAGSALAA